MTQAPPPPLPPARAGRRPLHRRPLIVALLALALLVAVFDWNWFRPALERYLHDKSNREVHADDLHVSLDAALRPVVRLRGLRIQNAPWATASQRPFVTAAEARFTFGWRNLLGDVQVITHMVMVGADIDLERRADGLRNWRLTRPDDRGPGRMQILRVEAHDSRIHILHHGLHLAMEADTTPLAEPQGELTQRIAFNGRYRDAPISGTALAGAVLSLRGTGDFFPLRAEAKSAQSLLEIDGRVADVLTMGKLDAQVKTHGPSLAQLAPFASGVALPRSQPFRAEAHVTREGDAVSVKGLKLALGESDLAGDVDFDIRDERNTLQARLQGQRVRWSDLPFSRDAAASAAKPGPSDKPATRRVLSDHALPLQKIDNADARLELLIASLQLPSLPALQGVRANASLQRGLLELTLLDTRVAGGRIDGRFTLDHRTAVAAMQVDVRARGLRVEKLWSGMPENAQVEGPLDAELKLSGHGPSLAAWAGSADGRVDISMQGGSINQKLDAKLGLNAGKLVKTFFTGDKQLPIRCAALGIDFVKGKGRTRQVVIDTAQTQVHGQGSVLLGEESWALLLVPQAHQRSLSSLTALDASLMAQGSFRDASYSIAKREQLDANKAGVTAATAGCAG